MREALRAGIAVYNAGYHHAAHDAWEDHWLDLERGVDDERLLHGLIQFTAAVYHARRGNWAGATGLAESAREYLAGLPDDHREVNVGTVRGYLGLLASDPECVEREPPPLLTHEGDALSLDELDFPSAAVAAVVLAGDLPGYDAAVVERAVDYARTDLDAGDEGSRFVTLVLDFARGEARGIVYDRLQRHVERREAREADAEGLFD